MARIRSIHPGQFTDSAFMVLEPAAMVLLFGLRCEADDNGIFKWDLAQLKVRILPTTDVDIGELMEQLVNTRQIYPYEINGKEYGILRNFIDFQRPHSPAFSYTPPAILPDGCRLHSKYTNNIVEITDPHDKSQDLPLERRGEEGREEERREEKGRGKGDAQPPGAHPGIILKQGKIFVAPQKDIDQWQLAYQAIDVLMWLAKISAWSKDVPESKRWTGTRINRGINRWLADENEKANYQKSQTKQLWCNKHPDIALKQGKCPLCK